MTDKERPRRYPSLAGPLLAVLSLCITAVILEAAIRLWGPAQIYMLPRQDSVILHGSAERLPYAFIPHAVIRSVYPSNPRGYFDSGNGIDHAFNSAGWRDVEHTVAKPRSTYRILGLGDSYLYGQGVRRSDICLTKLQGLLASGGGP